jgi:GNAT superfamily N-acetyltransferase
VSSAIRVAVLDAPPPALRSGREELDNWLARYGLAATRAGSARVYLAEAADGFAVGYFALSAGSVDPVYAGSRTRRGLPRHQIPVVLLARLAVEQTAQQRGVGRELVRRAMRPAPPSCIPSNTGIPLAPGAPELRGMENRRGASGAPTFASAIRFCLSWRTSAPSSTPSSSVRHADCVPNRSRTG